MIDWSPPDRHEDWIVEINLLVSFLFPDDPLFPDQTDSKEDIDCQVYDLKFSFGLELLNTIYYIMSSGMSMTFSVIILVKHIMNVIDVIFPLFIALIDLGVDQGDRQVPIAGHLGQALPEVGQSAEEVREARGVGDELLPLCRVENLYRPLDWDPPPDMIQRPHSQPLCLTRPLPAAEHRPGLLVTNPESLVRPDDPSLHQGRHVGEPLGQPGGVSPDTENIGQQEISDDCSSDHPGSDSLRSRSPSKVSC